MNYICHSHRLHMRSYGLQVISEPVNEPITLDQARLHMRLDSYGSPPEHADDQWILDNISTAREWCEFYSGRSLAPQIYQLTLNSFPHAWHQSYWADEIKLPMGPIAGVDSIIYTDVTGIDITVDTSEYTVDVSSDVGYIYPLINTCWPMAIGRHNAVRINYNAGYTTDLDSPNDMPLPKRFRSAMLLVLGYLYENRENAQAGGDGGTLLHDIPLGAAQLMDGMRLRMGFA